MQRYFPLLIAFLPLACGSPNADQAPASPDDVKLAHQFIKDMEEDESYMLGVDHVVQTRIDRQKVDSNALLRGSIQILRDGQQYEKRKATTFLGRLRDTSAVVPLVEALDDPSEALREDVCYALQRLHVKGEPAEPVLVRLRANDPSMDVRVAAAFAMGRPPDEKSIAVFKEGIEFTNKGWVRDSCETELESIGKLELPLPEKVYTGMSREGYQGIIENPRLYTVQRKCKKGNILYFEVVENRRHALLIPKWYRVKLD